MQQRQTLVLLTGLSLLGIAFAFIVWSYSRQFVKASDGWASPAAAKATLGFIEADFPESSTKVQYFNLISALRGYQLYFVCDGELNQLHRFAHEMIAPYLQAGDQLVIENAKEGSFKLVLAGPTEPSRDQLRADGGRALGWMQPNAASEKVEYRTDKGVGPIIIVDQTNGLLYYSFSN